LSKKEVICPQCTTHTVEIMFKIWHLQRSRSSDEAGGADARVPLARLPVKVTSGFLSNLDADQERNPQLLKERTPGERAFVDAFKAWDQYAERPLKQAVADWLPVLVGDRSHSKKDPANLLS